MTAKQCWQCPAEGSEIRMGDYLLRFITGGLVIVAITYMAKKGYLDIAGVLVLIPAVSLISYIFIGQSQGEETLRLLVVSSLLSLPALIVFMLSLIWLLSRYGYIQGIAIAFILWIIVAYISLKAYRWWTV